MELLPHFGVNGELSKVEFVRRLGRECTVDQVRELRLSLFEDAVRKDLADIGDDLVQRKKMGGGRTVKEKHIDDSWLLVGAIKRCECVPRILLKNRKRARNDLLKSQAKLREKLNGECQTTDVSENVRDDAEDEMKHDDNGKTLGGAGSGITGRMLGEAKQDADQTMDTFFGSYFHFSTGNLSQSFIDMFSVGS